MWFTTLSSFINQYYNVSPWVVDINPHGRCWHWQHWHWFRQIMVGISLHVQSLLQWLYHIHTLIFCWNIMTYPIHIVIHMLIFHDISRYFTIFHHISPYFIIFHHISPYFTIFHHISPYFSIFHHISPYFTIFHHISPYFTIIYNHFYLIHIVVISICWLLFNFSMAFELSMAFCLSDRGGACGAAAGALARGSGHHVAETRWTCSAKWDNHGIIGKSTISMAMFNSYL